MEARRTHASVSRGDHFTAPPRGCSRSRNGAVQSKPWPNGSALRRVRPVPVAAQFVTNGSDIAVLRTARPHIKHLQTFGFDFVERSSRIDKAPPDGEDMRAHDPDDSAPSLPASPRPFDEFAADPFNRDLATNASRNDGVFCFECEGQPELTPSASRPRLGITSAEVSGSGFREPWSRNEALKPRRRKSRTPRSIATLAVAARERVTRTATALNHGARRASAAAAGRVTSVRRRWIDAAVLMSDHAFEALHGGKRATYRLACRMQRRADVSLARLRAEGEAAKNCAPRGSSVAARALAALSRHSTEEAVHLSPGTSSLVRGVRRGGHRVARLVSSRSIGAAKAVTAFARALGVCVTALGFRVARVRAPVDGDAFEHQEFNGHIVAAVLAVALIGYGGLLAGLWRTPTESPGTRAAGPFRAHTVDARAVSLSVVPATMGSSVIQPSQGKKPPLVRTIGRTLERQPRFTPNVRMLNTLWQRRDTRSLDRAFATLRGETLAFRRCGMRVTEVDRAVARCEGLITTLASNGTPLSRSAIWTIDFQRSSGRWLIARVTTC
jgi:hypothetical protein